MGKRQATAGILERLHRDRQRLRAVGRAGDELLLSFTGTTLALGATGDDELAVAVRRSPGPRPRRAASPWREALGRPLLWSWTMTNNQGYEDAIQLEFAETVEDEPIVIQLVAIAGEVRVRLVAPEYRPALGGRL